MFSYKSILSLTEEALRRLSSFQWVAALLVRLFVGYVFSRLDGRNCTIWTRSLSVSCSGVYLIPPSTPPSRLTQSASAER
jgi:nitrate/nitrite transporter NarK